MLRSIVENVLVDFVGDGEHIVFNTQVANQFKLFPAEPLAGGVVWRVKDYRLRVMLRGLVLKSFAQLLFVERPLASPAAPITFRFLPFVARHTVDFVGRHARLVVGLSAGAFVLSLASLPMVDRKSTRLN